MSPFLTAVCVCVCGSIGLVDLAVTTILIMYGIITSYLADKEIQKMDESRQTAQDYRYTNKYTNTRARALSLLHVPMICSHFIVILCAALS